MKNKRGCYRILGKKWYGWSWIIGDPTFNSNKPRIFETDTFESAEDYVTKIMGRKAWAARANDWSMIKEMEG